MDNLCIKDKVFHITTDNAPNMTNGMDFLSAVTNIKHQRCAAHIINLIVKAGLENGDITKSVEKLRYFCKRIHASSKLNETLAVQCNIYKIEKRKVVLDIDIRWNSTYDMIKTGIHLKNPINTISNNLVEERDSACESLNKKDWDTAVIVCDLLEPFNEGKIIFKFSIL